MPSVAKARLEIVGNGDRVVTIGVLFERQRDHNPTQCHAQHFAEYDPQGVDAHQIPHAGEAQQ